MAKLNHFTIRVPGFEIVVRRKKGGPKRQPSFTGPWLMLITIYLVFREGVINAFVTWWIESWNVLEPVLFIVSILWACRKLWTKYIRRH